jgi:hypothetical protein
MANVIEFPEPRTAIEAEQRQEALGFLREKLTAVAEATIESGLQRAWEAMRSVPYWETLGLDDYIGLIGEAFRTEFERRYALAPGRTRPTRA